MIDVRQLDEIAITRNGFASMKRQFGWLYFDLGIRYFSDFHLPPCQIDTCIFACGASIHHRSISNNAVKPF